MFSADMGGNTEDTTVYIEDVFSSFSYAGTGGSQTIDNGIDLLGEGGMTIIKNRAAAQNHVISDTARGNTFVMSTNTTDADTSTTTGVHAFQSTGFSLSGSSALNNSTGVEYISWSFRKASKFFDLMTVSHTNGVATNVDLSSLGTVGMVFAKSTAIGDWYVWHRSLSAGNNLRLSTTAGQSSTNAHLSVTGTTLTIASGMASGTYVIHAWAHDTADSGVVQCDTFTADGSGNASISLGWEAQFVLYKRTNSSSGLSSWMVHDTTRGWNIGTEQELYLNTTAAESGVSRGNPTTVGFNPAGLTASAPYMYMAIRRGLMRQPTSGSEVLTIASRVGTGSAVRVSGVSGDLLITKGGTANTNVQDRVRGIASSLNTENTNVANTSTNKITNFGPGGTSFGSDSGVNASSITYFDYAFKRAPGFFDIVTYVGNAVVTDIAHNLKAVPSLMIVRALGGTNRKWTTIFNHFPLMPNNQNCLDLSTTNQMFGSFEFNKTTPTSSVFTIGGSGMFNNQSGQNHIAYLFADLPGVSKSGQYVGNGSTSMQIDCGFTSGARFVLIKAVLISSGGWYVFDTVRGIIVGSDGYWFLNSNAAPTTGDFLAPYSPGFEIVSSDSTVNAAGSYYEYFAIS